MKRLISFLAVLLLAGSAWSQVISQWTFETTLPAGGAAAGAVFGPVAPEVGPGTAYGLHSGPSIYTSPVGNGSAHSWSSTNWSVGDYYQFQVSTIGYSGILVEYDQISSSTGPGRFILSYSLDGGVTFMNAAPEYTVIPNSSPNNWNSSTFSPLSHYSFDLSSVSGLDNAASILFRITDTSTIAANGGTVATGGTDRVDNFTVGVVPEPTCALLFGAGLLGLALRRRRS